MENTTAYRLKKALELCNMKQIDLAEKTNIGRSAISQYLSGKVVPKQDKIYLLAQALNVNEGWLMGYDVPMDRNFDPQILSEQKDNVPILDDEDIRVLARKNLKGATDDEIASKKRKLKKLIEAMFEDE